MVKEGLEKIKDKFASEKHIGPKFVADFEELDDPEEREILERDAYEKVTYLLENLGVIQKLLGRHAQRGDKRGRENAQSSYKIIRKETLACPVKSVDHLTGDPLPAQLNFSEKRNRVYLTGESSNPCLRQASLEPFS